MWGMYFIGLVAYIPASPVQAYLSLTLKRIGFSTFDSNMLSIPSAVLQIILMLALAKSSEYFGERTWHCFFGEVWILPLLAALLALPSHGRNWSRFTLTTMISGCKQPLSVEALFGNHALTGRTSRSLFPPHRLRLDQ